MITRRKLLIASPVVIIPAKALAAGDLLGLMGAAGKIAQASASWAPPSFGGALAAWYKADVGLTLSGSNITSVADQSGNSRTVIESGVNSATYSAVGFNGGPGIITTFPACGLVSSAFNISSNVATFWCAVNVSTLGSSRRILSYYDPSGLDFNVTTGDLPPYTGGATNLDFLGNSVGAGWASAVASTNYRCIIVLDGAHQTLYINAVQQAQAAFTGTLGTASNKFYMGTNSAGDGAVMSFAEWGLASADGTSNVTNLDTYLKTKWGL